MATTLTRPYRKSKIHPYKLALWVACAGIIMMFTSLTSAYIVRMSAGNWLEFPLPSLFYVSTGVILLSSLTLYGTKVFFRQGKEALYKGLLVVTFVLGVVFLVLQYQAWMYMMNEMGLVLEGNPSGPFVYVISGIHAAHVLGGLGVLLVALIQAFHLPFKWTARRKLRLQLTSTYWHFVDFLWIYLFVFFLITR